VLGGVPTRVICTMEEYVDNYKAADPRELGIRHWDVFVELEEHCWNEFEKKSR
jgi:hypothetical protein